MTAAAEFTLAHAQRLDAIDPLRALRARFQLPAGVVYLDGNSLGAMPVDTPQMLQHVLEQQWGKSLIRSWNDHAWIGAPQRVGGKIAGIVGAAEDEVLVADSTSVNLYKLLLAIVNRRSEQTHILGEAGNFPTDSYIAQSVADQRQLALRLVPREQLLQQVSAATAAVVLTQVHYKSGARFDLAAVTGACKALGVPVLWDLSHSAGAIPVHLHDAGVEFAVGCGYKFFNGGPGAPAFLYVARSQQAALQNPLSGWMGHSEPFVFSDNYQPATGINRFLCGTPPVLSLLALEAGIDLFAAVDQPALWRKSAALFELFDALMAHRAPQLQRITPSDPTARGSQISYRHADAWPINRALIDKGVIGDFRAPDILRFGLTPLYLRFEDVWRAVDYLGQVLDTNAWDRPEYRESLPVT